MIGRRDHRPLVLTRHQFVKKNGTTHGGSKPTLAVPNDVGVGENICEPAFRCARARRRCSFVHPLIRPARHDQKWAPHGEQLITNLRHALDEALGKSMNGRGSTRFFSFDDKFLARCEPLVAPNRKETEPEAFGFVLK
ncbi:MAG: hypothetical protein SF187_18720 [Deltaproteobacteria bacterium]|nr:hypothetical protein [Deltaproteobacteria bacterium]